MKIDWQDSYTRREHLIFSAKRLEDSTEARLFIMYRFSIPKYANLTDKELEEYFCSKDIKIRSIYPPVTDTLNFKGKLRISWSFDVKYNKNIDLIFFPEENPFVNYAYLYAKEFVRKPFSNDFGDERLDKKYVNWKANYDINYDFVKEILSKAGFSENQQKRFFDMRFGSVLVPMEVEFEWYFGVENIDDSSKSWFQNYDEFLGGYNICLGLIRHYTILPQHIQLNFVDYTNRTKTIPISLVQKLLPTSALSIVHTQNDFFVDLLDKPDSKDGKVIAQLFSHKITLPTLKCPNNLSEFACDEYIYKIKEMHYKAQENYYNTNKSNLTNPIWRDNYLVLIWDILPNDWCRVWVLRMIAKNTISSIDSETNFSE
ncbi:hypothetical protein, partial [Campylobacter troglodytis]|uniref:hypothetical protein n=1 Tax=Campylobacter troglodytis TaxID=654363 RepID=UPI001157DC2D